MKEPVMLTALDLDYQGQGVCRYQEKVVFVKGMLKGETGLVRITKDKKTYFIGELINLKTTSMLRVNVDNPDDLHYAPLLHLNVQSQLDWQQKITEETFRKIAKMDVSIDPILCDNRDRHYRNKVTLHVAKLDTLKMGVFEPGSNRLYPVKHMVLASDPIQKVILKLNEIFKMVQLQDDTLKHITLRSFQQKVMLIFGTTKPEWSEKDIFLSHLSLPIISSIYQNILDNDYENMGKTSILLFGDETLEVNLGNLKFSLKPQAFFQINTPIALRMYEKVKSLIKGKVVIDAYAGMASIGQFISDRVDRVYAIESNHEAILSAEIALEENRIRNVQLIESDVSLAIERYLPLADTIVFDPPRSGLDDHTKQLLLTHLVPEIIYVSCDLKSLVRDINMLKAHYRVTSVTPVKMFYHTIETETIVRLEKM
ncbi:23S rRNA (uracil(1939)-C(5))-methyltransferase RlmD [Acholeplasma vituli]|uniref:23S rRNA (Uracil(1939)-C(5))-methyltransferase RlmD n=1 Tax=Paracholeplasma vituli TaxID=69473 RepID=A0ABT2PWG0_9MOLU|nr:23S rRNA (uracil(1939)-C(5))-methyltransferase RlmD [Paracholeplasma vituli]MCU0105291.1 23S rRNA (uracil(1939)-C(5))-methyltransferase RlmD [Paracholeplasma vituli]